MSTDPVHLSAIGTNPTSQVNGPSLPPQRHAGAVGLGPNYPLGPGLGDKVRGLAEEVKGKVLGRPGLVEHGRERRTGELMRKEREQDDAESPFKDTNGEGK